MKNERLEMRVELSRVLPHRLVRINSPIQGELVLMGVTAYAQKPTKKKQIKARKTLTSEPLDKMAQKLYYPKRFFLQKMPADQTALAYTDNPSAME